MDDDRPRRRKHVTVKEAKVYHRSPREPSTKIKGLKPASFWREDPGFVAPEDLTSNAVGRQQTIL